MRSFSEGSDPRNRWDVLVEGHNNALLLYNPQLGEFRTTEPDAQTPIPYPPLWVSQRYFRLLGNLFAHMGQLPPSLTAYLANGYFARFFVTRGLLGRGGTSCVYQVEHRLAGLSLGQYALKIVPVGEFEWLRRAISEVRLLERLSQHPHPLILGYRHCWIEEYQIAFMGPRVPCLFILMEFADLGNLEAFIRGRDLNHGRAKWQIFMNIAVALDFLHREEILHRDLKLSNVLVFKDERKSPLPFRFVISDLGTSVDVVNDEHLQRNGATGTIETMAPELLVEASDGHLLYRHSYASDVWSLGVIWFTLLFGVSPFAGTDGERRLRTFTDVRTLLTDLSLDIASVSNLEMTYLNRMMQRTPSRRGSMREFMESPPIAAMIREFGLDRFEDRRNESERRQPSPGDIGRSVPLPLSFHAEEPRPLRKFLRQYRFSLLLFLACLSVTQRTWRREAVHVIVCLFCVCLCMIYPNAAICVPAAIGVEFVANKVTNFLQLVLIVLLSLCAMNDSE
jgi:serine/threonine protein kinase